MTGTPIYVDFKSVPYAPEEVLEWERRMRLVEEWFTSKVLKADEGLKEIESAGITYMVVPDQNQNRTESGEGYRILSIKFFKTPNDLGK